MLGASPRATLYLQRSARAPRRHRRARLRLPRRRQGDARTGPQPPAHPPSRSPDARGHHRRGRRRAGPRRRRSGDEGRRLMPTTRGWAALGAAAALVLLWIGFGEQLLLAAAAFLIIAVATGVVVVRTGVPQAAFERRISHPSRSTTATEPSSEAVLATQAPALPRLRGGRRPRSRLRRVRRRTRRPINTLRRPVRDPVPTPRHLPSRTRHRVRPRRNGPRRSRRLHRQGRPPRRLPKLDPLEGLPIVRRPGPQRQHVAGPASPKRAARTSSPCGPTNKATT